MNGAKHRKEQHTGKNKNQTFTELAQDAGNFFANLKPELLKFKQSAKIDELFAKTEEFVQKYAKDLTTHQLRNIFQEVKKADDITSLKLIRPNLAYIAGRLDKNKNNEKTFVAFLDSLIREVQTPEQLENFKDFMEAIVAYHKFHGKN